MREILRIVEAVKRFGGTTALDGLSFGLREGEWLALLGPNGAGKTTTIRAICGRVRLDRGSIEWAPDLVPGRRAVSPTTTLGVVPQSIALYPLLTARENLEVFGALKGITGPGLRARVDWALEWTGLAARAREPVRRFSDGMRRRLNIACGVLHEPRIILLDEPTTGVDPHSYRRILEMLAELRREGATLLHATNKMEEAEETCDRIAILDGGRVIASGTLDELAVRALGPERRVQVLLEGPLPADAVPPGYAQRGSVLVGSMTKLADQLPELLSRIERSGGRVKDLRLDTTRLESVFLRITGRELRG